MFNPDVSDQLFTTVGPLNVTLIYALPDNTTVKCYQKQNLNKEVNNTDQIQKCDFKINTLQKKPKVLFSHRRNSGQPSHASDMASQMAVNSGIHLFILCFKHT